MVKVGNSGFEGVAGNTKEIVKSDKLLTEAAERLGIDLDNIYINDGIARTEIKITSKINNSDIKLLINYVKSKGAQKIEVNAGYIANEKLMKFLDMRVADGKPFMGGKVMLGKSKKTDFTIIYE
ncbi:hypothetical protein [Gilliamella sp. Pas-s25]|uniref:hypothetical protein n=1 Tax=Gilliamella sp. Pas-s25 TaxID=2687310 RepID=UPI001F2D0DF2|nr:hypothetical protein [Gilliamella sp. Pas-s25]